MPAEGLQDPRYCLSERLFRVRRQFLPLPLALLLKVQAAESDARKAPPSIRVLSTACHDRQRTGRIRLQ
jgi:hypothetical protein